MTRAMTGRTGFLTTDVGVIPADWRVGTIGDELQFVSGKAHEQFVSPSGEFVVVNSRFISTDGAVRKYSTANFAPARKGDVLMVMSDLPNGRALAKCFLVDRDNTYAVNQRVCIFRTRNHDPMYLKYILNRNPYFMAFDDGVQQTHLLNDTIRKCPLVLPPRAEQERIADALAAADDLIDSSAMSLRKKRAIKQGMMQELLTGRTRLPGFLEPWTFGPIGTLYSRHTGTTDPRQSRSRLFQHFSLPAFDDSERAAIEKGLSIDSVKFTVPLEAILVSKLNPRIPRIWAPARILPNAIASTEFVVVVPQSGVVRSFLSWLFKSDRIVSQMKLLATGTTKSHVRIHPSAIGELQASWPEAGEQQAIASVLDDADAEISALERRLEATRAVKQGMMQELLTGRTRLVPEEVGR